MYFSLVQSAGAGDGATAEATARRLALCCSVREYDKQRRLDDAERNVAGGPAAELSLGDVVL